MMPVVVFTGTARSGKDTAARFLCEAYNGVSIAFADPIKRFMAGVYGLSEAQLWGNEKEVVIPCPVPRTVHLELTLAHVVGMDMTDDRGALRARIEAWTWGLEHATPRVTTPRRLMQTFGTEVVRSVRPDLWLEVGLRDAQRILEGGFTYTRTLGVVPTGTDKNFDLVCITDGRFRNELLGVKRIGGVSLRIERPAENGLSAEARGHASEVEQKTLPDWWFDGVVSNDSDVTALRENMLFMGHTLLALPSLNMPRPPSMMNKAVP